MCVSAARDTGSSHCHLLFVEIGLFTEGEKQKLAVAYVRICARPCVCPCCTANRPRRPADTQRVLLPPFSSLAAGRAWQEGRGRGGEDGPETSAYFSDSVEILNFQRRD